jgi:hypothetical protein
MPFADDFHKEVRSTYYKYYYGSTKLDFRLRIRSRVLVIDGRRPGAL